MDVQEDARAVLKEQAAAIRSDAQGRCPVDKGILKRSIRATVAKKKLEATVSAGGKVGRIDTYYAQFVEFGTKKGEGTAVPFSCGSGARRRNTRKVKNRHVQRHQKGGGWMSALTAFQAIYTLLTSSTTLMAKIKGVYDVVPEGTAGAIYPAWLRAVTPGQDSVGYRACLVSNAGRLERVSREKRSFGNHRPGEGASPDRVVS